MKRAVVIGATSMLAERLIELLKSRGVGIFTCGRSPSHDAFVDLGSDHEIALPDKVKADVLFNCAAAFGDDSPEGCWLNEKVNALGAYQIAKVAAAAHCRSVVSSGTVSSCASTSRTALGSYGASKARGEEILDWALSRNAITFASLQLPQLYDENGHCCTHQAWFGRIVAYASAGKVLRLPGGGAKRNFLHVVDAAKLMIAAGEKGMQGIFPSCHPESESYDAIANIAFEIFGLGGHVEIAAEKQPFREVCIPASSGTFSAIDVYPKISMRQGLLMIKEGGHAHAFGPLDVG